MCARNKQTDAVNQGHVHNDALLSQHLLPKDKGISVGVDNSHPYTSASSLAIKGYRAQGNIPCCVLQEFLPHRNHARKKNAPFGVVCYTAVDDKRRSVFLF